MQLAAEFLAHAGPLAAVLGAEPGLEAVLQRLWTTARTAWPEITLAPEDFARHLAETLAADAPVEPLPALEATEAADLYLACACARGDAAALAEFERRHITPLPPNLGPGDGSSGFIDEVKQVLRVRLLVGEAGQPPRIAGYTGRGPLGAWVRISAGRVALNLRPKFATRRPTIADEAPALHGAFPDPEIELLRSEHGDDFREAFVATLAALPARDGTLLRLYYLDGVSAEAIGTMYGTSKRTAQRWIADIRAAIVDSVRRLLRTRLGASTSQLDGLIDLLHRDLDTSILTFLKRSGD